MNWLTYKIWKIFYLGVLVLLCFSCDDHQLFRSLSVSSTGVDFINEIEETKNVNIGQSLSASATLIAVLIPYSLASYDEVVTIPLIFDLSSIK